MIMANSPDKNIKITLGIDVFINDSMIVASKITILYVFNLVSFNNFRPVLNIKKTTATLIPLISICFKNIDIK